MNYKTIDLNADLGETEGDYLALLPLITSANVACGGHAGGGELLAKTVSAALEAKVQVGAHPSYPDRENFGRISMKDRLSREKLIETIFNQISSVKSELEKHGASLSHIKAHGALYNDAMVDTEVAETLVQACVLAAKNVPLFGLPGSTLEQVCKEQGVEYIAEGFLDRAYNDDGTLVSRTLPNSVLNHSEAAKQAEELIRSGSITSYQGKPLALTIQTLCVHADTPDATKTVLEVRELLESHQVEISRF